MLNLSSILTTFLGYPASEIIKGFSDLRHFHKAYRNIWRLSLAGLGAAWGGVIPTVMVPKISEWLAQIIEVTFKISTGPSFITGNLALIWIGTSLGLVVGKETARAYYYLKYKDTNSSHILYESELEHLTHLYPERALDLDNLRKNLGRIFHHLVAKIHQKKNKTTVSSPLDPLDCDWTKDQFKSILKEFRIGNADLYAFYVRLEHTKARFTELRLSERVMALDNFMMEPNPNYREMSPINRRNPSVSFNFPAPRHRRRATINIDEVRRRAPKLGRYMTQWAEYQGHAPHGIQTSLEVDSLKENLLAQERAIKERVNDIPLPIQGEAVNSFASPPPPMGGSRRI